MSESLREEIASEWQSSLQGLADVFDTPGEVKLRWQETCVWVGDAFSEGRDVSIRALFKQHYRLKKKEKRAQLSVNKKETDSLASSSSDDNSDEDADYFGDSAMVGSEASSHGRPSFQLRRSKIVLPDSSTKNLNQMLKRSHGTSQKMLLKKLSRSSGTLLSNEQEARKRKEKILAERETAVAAFAAETNLGFPALIKICSQLCKVANEDGFVRSRLFYDFVTSTLGIAATNSDSEDSLGESESDTDDEVFATSVRTESEEEIDCLQEALPLRIPKHRVEQLLNTVMQAYRKPLVAGGESEATKQITSRKTLENTNNVSHSLALNHSYRRSSLSSVLIDYRQILLPIGKIIAKDVHDRIRLFFILYGGKRGISITGLCALMYWGDRLVAKSLKDAEKFMAKIDEDGDGSITWVEFQDAVEREPFILETIVRQHTNVEKIRLSEAIKMRKYVHRTDLTWASILLLWNSLLENGGKPDVSEDGLIEVLIPQKQFETILLKTLEPPEPDDGTLVRVISSIFVAGQNMVAGRKFVIALGSVLGELNIGISECKDKASFYFSLYNIDGDTELSKEEIYRMLYSGSGDLGKQIIEASALLEKIDIDGDKYISYDEYVLASKDNPDLLKFFED